MDRKFLDALGSQVVVCDGAMGTMLHAGGVSLERCLPELNVTLPTMVQAIHRAYVAAGVDVIQTNTFGANRFGLARYGFAERVDEFNRAAVHLAQEARVQEDTPVFIAGSVGPTASSPLGRWSPEEVGEAFAEQIQSLVASGVDLLIFETFGDLRELVEAIKSAQAISDLPIVAQMTFADDGKTLAGDTPSEVARALQQLDVAVVGVNCTQGPQGLLDILRYLGEHTRLPLSAQPNAGVPSLTSDGRLRYTTDGPYLASYARRYVEAGAGVVGGCCGTTPSHLEAMVRAVHTLPPPARAVQTRGVRVPEPPRDSPAASPGAPLAERLAAKQFVVACELRPSSSSDAEQAVQDAERLHRAGAELIMVAPDRSPRAHLSIVTLAVLIQQRAHVETVLTVNTWEKSMIGLQADLLGAHALGIQNVLCRTGRPQFQGAYPSATRGWEMDPGELIKLLRSLNDGYDYNRIPIGRATRFLIGTRINPTAEDRDRELSEVRRRIACGTDFLVTTPLFELDSLDSMLADLDGTLPPVIARVIPLPDFRYAEYLQHEVPDLALPAQVLERMAKAGGRGREEGLDIARELMLAVRARYDGLLIQSASGSVGELEEALRMLPG